MSDRARGKNHPPPGTPPRVRRPFKPGRGRPAKGFDVVRNRWIVRVSRGTGPEDRRT